MIHLRPSLLLMLGSLSLTACTVSDADAYSLDKALTAAREMEQYRFDATMTVDGEVTRTAACDLDLATNASRCTATADGGTYDLVTDLTTGTVFLEISGISLEDTVVTIPSGVSWISFTSDEFIGVDIGDASMYVNPLAGLGDTADLKVIALGEVERDGETLRRYKATVQREAVIGFASSSGRTAPAPAALVYTFYVDANSTLRGLSYGLNDEISAATMELWFTPATFASFVLPDPNTTTSFTEIFGTSSDGILQGTVDQVALQFAEAIARNTNAIGAFSATGNPSGEDLLTAVLESGIDDDASWTRSEDAEVRSGRCVVVEYTAGELTAVAHVRLDISDRAVAGSGLCVM